MAGGDLGLSLAGSIRLEVEEVRHSGRRFGRSQIGFEGGRSGCRVFVDGAEVALESVGGGDSALVSVSASSSGGAFTGGLLSAKLYLGAFEKALGLTFYVLGMGLSKASATYSLVGLGRLEPPKQEPPIKYPEEPDPKVGWGSFAYPYVAADPEKVYPYTIFLLAKTPEKYCSMLALADGDASAYLDRGLSLRVEAYGNGGRIGPSFVLAVGLDERPYRSVAKTVELVSEHTLLKPRRHKQRPHTVDYFGWCTWNALQLEDLSHTRVAHIVRDLRARGVPVTWVILDDGWQVAEGRAQVELEPDSKKFPSGFEGVVAELKGLGVKEVGLWHTVNVYWNGASDRLFEALGAPRIVDPTTGRSLPPADLDGALKFYERFYGWVKAKGFSFVKVDNQSFLRSGYAGRLGASPRNVKVAQELAGLKNGLWTLNCMSMVPESYSYYFSTNVVRASNDYIPFWRSSAKLHLYWCFYNSVFFSQIAVPDFDMWMSYDPSAKLYAAASVLSGGPVYITDRDPDRTDVALLRRIVLPDGRIVRSDEPALPTEDSLFLDPYNEPRLLKVAAKVGHTLAVGVFNLYREDRKIVDSVDLARLGVELGDRSYVSYGVFGGPRGVVEASGRVVVELGGGDAEILVLAPLMGGKALIGLKEYLLPPSAVKASFVGGGYQVETLAEGTLVYFEGGGLVEQRVGRGVLRI